MSINESGENPPLLQYWQVLRKRWVTIVAFTALLVVTVFIASITSTKYYQAKAVIEISPVAPQILEVEGVASIGASGAYRALGNKYYETQYEIIQSRNNLQTVLNELVEVHGIEDFEGVGVGTLRSHLKVKPDVKSNLVKISFEWPDPEVAAIVSNTIAEVYIDSILSRAEQQSQQALEFLQEERVKYRQESLRARQSVVEYRKQESLLGTDHADPGVVITMQGLEKQLAELLVDLEKAEARYNGLSAQLSRSGAVTVANILAEDDQAMDNLLVLREKAIQTRDELATRYTEVHPDIQRANKNIADIEGKIQKQVGLVLAKERARVELLRTERAELGSASESARDQVMDLDAELIELAFRENEAERAATTFKDLDQRFAEVQLASVMTANNVWFMDRAQPPKTHSRPDVMNNVFTALLVGLIAGAALAFMLDYLDSTVRSREDVEEGIGVPLLGVVPQIERSRLQKLADQGNIAVHQMPRSNFAEALRQIRTALSFASAKRPLKNLLITSAAPLEGKSFVSSNLATIIAMGEQRVLLIDADLRRPTLHKVFHIPNDVGLSDVLARKIQPAAAAHSTEVKNLDVMIAGPIPPNPAELLRPDNFQRVMHELGKHYDLLLFDSPPVKAVSDPRVMAPHMDGIILVVEANRTSRTLARHISRELAEANPNILGAIVNKLNVQRNGYYYYYDYKDYTYYASDEEEKDQELASR